MIENTTVSTYVRFCGFHTYQSGELGSFNTRLKQRVRRVNSYAY